MYSTFQKTNDTHSIIIFNRMNLKGAAIHCFSSIYMSSNWKALHMQEI
jgi:hypothetical protein